MIHRSSSRPARAIFQDFILGGGAHKRKEKRGWRENNGARHGGHTSVSPALERQRHGGLEFKANPELHSKTASQRTK